MGIKDQLHHWRNKLDGLLELVPDYSVQRPEVKRARVTREVLTEAVKDKKFLDHLIDAALRSGKFYEFAEAFGTRGDFSSLTEVPLG